MYGDYTQIYGDNIIGLIVLRTDFCQILFYIYCIQLGELH